MNPLPLAPPCRWRGHPVLPGKYKCGSPKLVAAGGVTLAFCGTCPVRDHEATAQAPPPVPPVPRGGPGTELKRLLAGLGLSASHCDCTSRAVQMDRWGPAGCREHRAEIVAWLEGERKKRGWWETAKAAVRAVTGDFMPNPLDPLGSLLDEAVRRAEAKGGAG